MCLPDLRAALPPQSDHVDELGIRREELSERLHLVPIPGGGKGIDNLGHIRSICGRILVPLISDAIQTKDVTPNDD